MVQMPPQQSVPFWQMSPAWPQYEGCAQMPFWQNCEQHWVPAVQLLPSVLQVPFSGAHLPPVQVPLQH